MPPDFPEPNDEELLSAEKIEGRLAVLELVEDVFVGEDPTDPLLLAAQPASSFGSGIKAA
ncbi:MAG: hypothetical protein WC637_13785 [Victivallales bacterium]